MSSLNTKYSHKTEYYSPLNFVQQFNLFRIFNDFSCAPQCNVKL